MNVTASVENAGDVPGTLLLVNTGSESDNNRIILQPVPSDDKVRDPLNWSRSRKLVTISLVYSYVFAIGIATAVQYSVLTEIGNETGLTLTQLNLGTGLMFLFLGWALPLWQPLAVNYGRRGVYVISTILSIVPMVWAPFSSGPSQWYAHRILLGIFAAPVESLPEVSIPDLFFAHERGTFMALYAFTLLGSNFLAPFFAGFINDGANWHWVMYFGALVLAVDAIALLFFLEDTTYFRSTVESSAATSNDLGSVDGEKTFSPVEGTTEERVKEVTFLDRQTGVLPQPPWKLFNLEPGRRPFLQVLRSAWHTIVIIFVYPNILWSGLLYGLSLAWYNVGNGTTSAVLSAEPYNFSTTTVGVAYLSPFLGSGLASLWAGQASDWIMLRLAARKNGVREPEQRLWPLVFSGTVTSTGLVLWGVGASYGLHFMCLIVGLGMIGFGAACAGAISLSYGIDCFKEISGDSMVSVILIRNTLGFAFSYAISPWINTSGLRNTFIAVSLLCFATHMSCVLVVYVGKEGRRRSARRYWKTVHKASSIQ